MCVGFRKEDIMVIIKITNANFDKEVLQSDKPVLIDFWGVLVRTLSDAVSDY